MDLGQENTTGGSPSIDGPVSTDGGYGKRPKTLQLSDEEPMRIDEEMATWLTIKGHKDIVDLSDEDTLRWKKKNGVPPSSTHLHSRDSAFEESDKKSGSEDSQKDHEFYPETEYVEVGTPTKEAVKEIEEQLKSSRNVYTEDPTHLNAKDVTTTDSGVDEHEYLTPETARLRRLSPVVMYNQAFQSDNPDQTTLKDVAPEDENQQGGTESVKRKVVIFEKQRKGVKDPSKTHKNQRKSDRKITSTLQSQNEEDEITEYSTPKSNRSSLFERSDLAIDSSADPTKADIPDDEEERPAVPPRPKVRPMSGLIVRDVIDERGDHYARVNKKKRNKLIEENSKADTGQKIAAGENINKDITSKELPIEPPARRRRPRKRSKQIQAPEEDVYDGTKDYADLEIDPSFYTDSSKTKIKRSSRIPVMQPDPNDTRYWITVTNDY